MNKSKLFFIKIDDFIFKKIDQLKNEGLFQKFNELISNLEDEQQKTLIQLFSFGIILIPFLFVCILWFGNHKLKNSIQTKNQIIEQINFLNGNKEDLINVSANYVSNFPIQGKEDLDNKIRNLMSAINLDQSKFTIINYNHIATSNSIEKSESLISFKNFGTSDFSNFIKALIEQEKFKITRVNLNKNSTTNLLYGEITLIHLGKTSSF